MLNAKTLRQQYRVERARTASNCKIGAMVLTILAVFWGAIALAVITRLACLAIVALHNIIK